MTIILTHDSRGHSRLTTPDSCECESQRGHVDIDMEAKTRASSHNTSQVERPFLATQRGPKVPRG